MMPRFTTALAAAATFAFALSACSDKSTSPAPSGLPSDHLQAFYSFDTDASDSSGNGADGTLLGGATTAGTLIVGDNDSDALSLPNTVLDGLNDFTVAAWVRINTVQTGGNQFLSGATAAEDNSVGIWYSVSTSRWKLTIANVDYEFPLDVTIKDHAWHHIAVMREDDKGSFIIDGALLGTPVSVSSDPLEIDPDGLIIGQDQDVLAGGFDATQCLAGEVDNLRIYSRALTAAEILQIKDEAR